MWIYHGGLGNEFNMYPKWRMSKSETKVKPTVQYTE